MKIQSGVRGEELKGKRRKSRNRPLGLLTWLKPCFYMFILFTFHFSLFTDPACAQPLPIPTVSIGVTDSDKPADVATKIRILILLTILTLAPAILIMMTSFTRIVIVLSLLRQAIGAMNIPPNQVVIGLSLFLTFFVMSPVLNKVNTEALQPYIENRISQEEAIDRGVKSMRGFMLRYTREKDLSLFVELSRMPRPKTVADVPTTVIIPAFVISELKTAFQVGFMIFIPFLVIDMVVASALMSMGMMMLPPVMIALPFKLMLFVLVDGWYLIVGSLVKSFY
jgi:flagellar biosynthetic protein FliP